MPLPPQLHGRPLPVEPKRARGILAGQFGAKPIVVPIPVRFRKLWRGCASPCRLQDELSFFAEAPAVLAAAEVFGLNPLSNLHGISDNRALLSSLNLISGVRNS